MANLPAGRRFTENEVALILKAAAELQERDAPAGRSGKLTQAQLEQVAAEVGINAAVIRRAIREVDARAHTRPGSRLFGGPAAFTVEREVDGEVPVAAFESVLETIRRATGQLGEVSTVGRLFGWRGKMRSAKAEVSLSPSEGRTTIRVHLRLDEVAINSYAGGGIGIGVTGGFFTFAALVNPIGAAAGLAAGAVAVAGLVGARLHFGRSASRYYAEAAALADALADQVSLIQQHSEGNARPDRLTLPT